MTKPLSKKAKIILAVLLVLVIAALIPVSVLVLIPEWKLYSRRADITVSDAALSNGSDRIHFLNTGHSDAFLLERVTVILRSSTPPRTPTIREASTHWSWTATRI